MTSLWQETAGSSEDAVRLERLRSRLRCVAPRALPCTKRAAVACLLRLGSRGELQALFIRRAAHPGDPWSGDIAWPGGRLQPGESELDAAQRETEEEIGFDLRTGWELLGPLDDRVAVWKGGVAKLVVRAFVFLRSGTDVSLLQLRLQEKEVAAAWWVPLSCLTDPPGGNLSGEERSVCQLTHTLFQSRSPSSTCPSPDSRPASRCWCATAQALFASLSLTSHLTRLQRDARVAAVASRLGLCHALFPFVQLPPPPTATAFGPTRLWGVTLGLCETLVRASDGEEARLRVEQWRFRSSFWHLIARLLGALRH